MTALIIALAAAVVGVLVVVAIGQRRRVLSSPRRTDGADELRRTQLELRWARQLSALSETLDLDELLSRVLQGAAQLANGDASAVALWGKGEPPIVKAMNLTSDEALPLLGSWPAESRSRALTVRYRFPGETVAANAVQFGVLSRSRRNRAPRPGPWGSSGGGRRKSPATRPSRRSRNSPSPRAGRSITRASSASSTSWRFATR